MGIRIIGVGGHVPSRAVSNEELAHRVDTSHDWIVSHTGICERRLAEPDEAPSDLGCAAARCCLSDAGVEASAVDLIVVACATPDQSQPAVACMIRRLLAEHGLSPAAVDLLVLHQSNLRMIEAIMRSLEMPPERTVTTLEVFGNTAAASIPLTLQKAAEQGRLRGGARVVLCGFGGGLSWGVALIEWRARSRAALRTLGADHVVSQRIPTAGAAARRCSGPTLASAPRPSALLRGWRSTATSGMATSKS